VSALTYGRYLKVKAVVACQEEIAKAGKHAHDELLFIVTHQTYELWFKKVLHELDAARRIMGAEFVNERELGRALHYLERVIKVQDVLVDQIDVVIRAISGIPIADRDASTGTSLPRSDVIRLELAPLGAKSANVRFVKQTWQPPAVRSPDARR
jgi:tryptophan 2,3-dioxygenase